MFIVFFNSDGAYHRFTDVTSFSTKNGFLYLYRHRDPGMYFFEFVGMKDLRIEINLNVEVVQ